MLTEPEVSERRFLGLVRLFGESHAARIRRAHIAVVGIGGVGSWSVEALARSGVGQLTLVDLDHVSESNINRQLHALESTLGQSKVSAMAERIGQIHSECRLNLVEDFISPENVHALMPHNIDVLIDATDQVIAKVALAEWALQQHKPMVMVGAAGGKKQAQLVELADLMHATHDPLLASVRQRLRKSDLIPADKKTSGIHVVFSRESITKPNIHSDQGTSHGLNCHGYGSLVTVTATFGHCAAGWALNHFSDAMNHI